tara:strand:- start:64 stop:462 length:399 start_codon:yes stop_codon:yes gene_type:complete
MNSELITKLDDLKLLRSAPCLNNETKINLLLELSERVKLAEWVTLGIMAPSTKDALNSLRRTEEYFSFTMMEIIETPDSQESPVFLKANQKSGEVRIRAEKGLGEGILISEQSSKLNIKTSTWGPLPLDFFN